MRWRHCSSTTCADEQFRSRRLAASAHLDGRTEQYGTVSKPRRWRLLIRPVERSPAGFGKLPPQHQRSTEVSGARAVPSALMSATTELVRGGANDATRAASNAKVHLQSGAIRETFVDSSKNSMLAPVAGSTLGKSVRIYLTRIRIENACFDTDAE